MAEFQEMVASLSDVADFNHCHFNCCAKCFWLTIEKYSTRKLPAIN